MNTENRETLSRIVSELEELRRDIFNFDYNADNLWEIQEAIHHLNQVF